jgi:peroxiredoxin
MKKFFSEELIKNTLKLAGVYNLFLALLIIFFPNFISPLFNVDSASGPGLLWPFTALLIGVMGIGFLLASVDLEYHWGIVFLGALSKLITALVFLKAIFWNGLPTKFILFVALNDLIWLAPFYFALDYAYDAYTKEDSPPKKFNDLINIAKTNEGKTLLELSTGNRVLLVFVRHLGCTFCRETVHEISKLESVIKSKKLNLVFVHMSDPAFGDDFFSKYFSYPVSHISDPQRLLYQSLGLKRGSLPQVFGPSTFVRGFWAALIKGHGLGQPEGDPMQLGGYYILSEGRIVFEHKANKASESFDPNIIPEI